jgi:hypothetical protein
VAIPIAVVGLLAGCGGGDDSETQTGTAAQTGQTGQTEAAGGSDVAAVTADQLKGKTIQLARFFGDCEETRRASPTWRRPRTSARRSRS